MTSEHIRLTQDRNRTHPWKRWGPYLSERQWGTVREDYSPLGTSWDSLTHSDAPSRAYRWGEDGLLGFSDRQNRLCFALALWNERDPILKERLFGLTGPEGNHGEDVKECYYYLDATPTYSYSKALYKYPQTEFPYDRLTQENRQNGLLAPEFELLDTGIFEDNRYFDITAEFAKDTPEDIGILLTIANRGPEPATLHLLPTLWFRNTWSWGTPNAPKRPELQLETPNSVLATHETLGDFVFTWEGDAIPLFTENESNNEKLWGVPNPTPYVKDAFHRALIHNQTKAVNPNLIGTKFAPHYVIKIPSGAQHVVRLRLTAKAQSTTLPFSPAFDAIFEKARSEADAFHQSLNPPNLSSDAALVSRQARAGLLWSKQFYHYIVKDWLHGDPKQPAPPIERLHGRNSRWTHFYANDLLSMPDKWEYPWFAAWDLAFHMIPMAELDPDFAKGQLKLLLREWYMHPNGQIPAYEFAFHDVNPPVHAWAAWRIYKMTGSRGHRDRPFLESVFQKLLLNFTWWVNRKDAEGNNLFQGGFLGLDNIGVFDRSKPLPTGGHLLQSDGTAWMAFYCLTMLAMALELAQDNAVYEDLASKFFEHYVSIADALNHFGGNGLWDEQDGFYYDELSLAGQDPTPLRTRSLVGLLPLIAVEVLEEQHIRKLSGFAKRMQWFIDQRQDLSEQITWCDVCPHNVHRILAIPSRDRLQRLLTRLLDENEFLSPHGIRSLSRYHLDHPYVFHTGQTEHRVDYVPGESNSYMFGGNSNWRGPVWFPINYLIIEALERYAHFYGSAFKVECPTGSGNLMSLDQVASELSTRHASLFLADPHGQRPCHGTDFKYATDPHWKNLVLFHEYFHGETGRGCGASHQTGWTALVVRCLT